MFSQHTLPSLSQSELRALATRLEALPGLEGCSVAPVAANSLVLVLPKEHDTEQVTRHAPTPTPSVVWRTVWTCCFMQNSGLMCCGVSVTTHSRCGLCLRLKLLWMAGWGS